MTKNIKNSREIDKEFEIMIKRISSEKLSKTILKRNIILGMNLENKVKLSIGKIHDFEDILHKFIDIVANTNIITKEVCEKITIKIETIKSILYDKFQCNYNKFNDDIYKNINDLDKEIVIKGENLHKDIVVLDEKIKGTLGEYENNIKNIEKDSKDIFSKLDKLQTVYNNTEMCSSRMEESLHLLESQMELLAKEKDKQFESYINEFKDFNQENIYKKLDNINEHIKDSNDKVKENIKLLDMNLYQANLLINRIVDPKNGKMEMLKIKRLANSGDIEMQLKLANIYEKEENLKEAFRWYLEAAENNNAEAQYQVGRYYENSYGTNRSVSKALAYYEKSAENDYIEAIYKLGEIYEKEEFGTKDFEKAFFYFLAGAELGNAECQFKVGDYYYTGVGVDVNYNKAIKWLEKSKDNGFKLAKNLLHEIESKLENERISKPEKVSRRTNQGTYKSKKVSKNKKSSRRNKKNKSVYGLIKENIKKLKKE